MIIDVNNKGILYEREVWNFEDALGWIGGLIGLIYALVNSLFQPFLKNSLVFKVQDNSKVAEAYGLNTYKFRCCKILYSLPCTVRCCFTKHFHS